MKKQIEKTKKFITEDIWKIEFTDIPKIHILFFRIIRIIVLAVKGFFNHNCLQKASGLTYFSLISIIPTLAMAFGIAQGFGFKQSLIREIEKQLSSNQEAARWIIDFANKYLDSSKGGVIAGVGFAILIWSLMRLLGSIEASFNDIWDVTKSRSFIRKFSDYLSLMIIALLFIISSSSMVVFVQTKVDIPFLGNMTGLLLGYVIPYLLIWLVFTLMLYIIPNTNVKFVSALVGGVLAGTAFQLLQYFYIKFQVDLSQLNPIYGSFAAFPVFLVWLNSSWLVVLFGAELSYATQNVKNFEFEADTKNISYNYKKQVLLLVSHYIVKKFVNEEGAPTLSEIAYQLKLPIRLATDIIYELSSAKIVTEVVNETSEESGFMPGVDVNKLTIGSVIRKIEEKGTCDFLSSNNDLLQIKQVLNQWSSLSEESVLNKKLIDII
ncbi:MAG: YihY/virulence factor BrkB family protein [Marinilabiliaceae bacterium]|nr:YihY/virulence factor BrkB family protein [Marinilabiliaceae bacterium]